jgi:hypothetical protein
MARMYSVEGWASGVAEMSASDRNISPTRVTDGSDLAAASAGQGRAMARALGAWSSSASARSP